MKNKISILYNDTLKQKSVGSYGFDQLAPLSSKWLLSEEKTNCQLYFTFLSQDQPVNMAPINGEELKTT